MTVELVEATWIDLDGQTGTPESPSWVGEYVPMRRRVIRDGRNTGAPFELPEADSLPAPGDAGSDPEICPGEAFDSTGRTGASGTGVVSEDQADVGDRGGVATALAWALGYRNGLEQGRADGYGEGHARGSSEGLAAAQAVGREQVEQAITAMAEQMDQLLALLEETISGVASEATTLGLGVAEAVLEREISGAVDPGAEAIARAARLLPDLTAGRDDQLRVRLNPSDVSVLGGGEPVQLPGRDIQIIADGEVAPGGCLMELGATRVDASVEAAMARVRAVLSC